ncbi:MAG: peptidase [Chloroflexi bacterium]|nr:peptidase [Chloroflexota bacterium]
MLDLPTRQLSPLRSRRLRRAPAALIAGLAVVLGAPMLIGSTPPPRNQVLADVAMPAPTSAPPAAAQAPADVAGLISRPDPAGEDSSPSRRFPPPPETLTGYVWPIWNASLTLPFGPTRWGSRVVDGEPFHDGIDLATHCRDRIVAAHDGVVLAAGRRYDDFMGWVGDLTAYKQRLDEKQLWASLPIVVVIDDGNGYRSMYAHFRRVVVAPGDVVAAGDLIGYEGATGRATGCHLHYGLFSPDEVATFGLNAEAAANMLLPTELAARINPLLVLPPLEDALIH